MKANICFVSLTLALTLTACQGEAPQDLTRPQAVRAIAVRSGPVVEGRTSLAELLPTRTVRVLAQVPGTVAALEQEVGQGGVQGVPLVRIAAPDVSARISRAAAERARVEAERGFACAQREVDRTLAGAGDLSQTRLDASEKGCAAAEQALQAAQAAEREAGVAGTRAVERAPFDGEVLDHLVDPGQTVMPGTPLLVWGSAERRLRLRLPQAEVARLAVGTRAASELGGGRVVELGAQAVGPARLVEVWVALDAPPVGAPAGSTWEVTLVVQERADATAVPEGALGRDEGGDYVLLVEADRLRRQAVEPGPRAEGWVAVEPALPAGALVVEGALAALDLDRPVLAVTP